MIRNENHNNENEELQGKNINLVSETNRKRKPIFTIGVILFIFVVLPILIFGFIKVKNIVYKNLASNEIKKEIIGNYPDFEIVSEKYEYNNGINVLGPGSSRSERFYYELQSKKYSCLENLKIIYYNKTPHGGNNYSSFDSPDNMSQDSLRPSMLFNVNNGNFNLSANAKRNLVLLITSEDYCRNEVNIERISYYNQYTNYWAEFIDNDIKQNSDRDKENYFSIFSTPEFGYSSKDIYYLMNNDWILVKKDI